jgi:integrase
MATIRKRNDKWQVQVRRQGYAPTAKSFVLKSDALEWSRELERQADRQELPTSRHTLKQITLGELVTRYKDTVTTHKKGARDEGIVLNAFLREKICKKLLADITPSDFIQYKNKRLKLVQSSTLKRQLNPIHHMFQIAINEWDIPLKGNPLDKVALKAKDNRRERRLEDGEYEKLLNAANTRQNPYIPIVIIFATETAMRRGEILNLSWRQVDLKRRCVTILESKNGYSRTIPLTPKAYALLHDLDRDHEQVFPLTADALKMAWGRILKVANIEDLHFHDLRHEAVSRFFEMGLTVPEVASISGHRDVRMLLRYAHANTSTLQAKLECKS